MRGKKESLKGAASTGSMLLCLALLVLGVMRLPQFYGHYNDERTLNRPEYAENEVNIYSCDYASVTEKLQDIVYYEDKGIELTSMILPPAGDTEVSDEELKEILQAELDQMHHAGILLESIDLGEYVFGYRQLRNIYPANGDRLRGRISYWEIIFEHQDDRNDRVVILADTQYHKFYRLSVSGAAANRMCFALQEWVAKGIKGGGKSGAGLADELLSSLSEQFAVYYGGTVPEKSEKTEADTDRAALGPATSAYGNGAAAESPKNVKKENNREDKPYGNIYYLEDLFYETIENKYGGNWYYEFPVSIDMGNSCSMNVLVIYDNISDVFSMGIPFPIDDPEVG